MLRIDCYSLIYLRSSCFLLHSYEGVDFMVFNANINNISVISWRRVLLVEEAGVPRDHHRLAASH